MANNGEKIQVCPNCGLIPNTVSFTSCDWLAWQGTDIISGVFTCQKCGYYGSPLYVKKKDYKKIKFKKRKLGRARFPKPNILVKIACWIAFLNFLVIISLALAFINQNFALNFLLLLGLFALLVIYTRRK
ncbi:hypothetical protein COU37_01540 [Candidatus Micrarchaeota archaeon CG10_big_fil_rev_8_21_14_0_10_45_29]|nr:MAG: hypothetical protein COU37_01540 [Candidatus Micrarchaeota archaeon CG10_big_fil_rev_8_21_14_0_10_45_29]